MNVRKILTALFVAVMLLFGVLLLPTQTKAAEIVETGSLGAELTWTLDSEGALIISGTGKMADYRQRESPLYSICTSIKTVLITEGVTSIGSWAFYGCKNLTSITIAEGVTSIGKRAFCNCTSLTSVIIPDGVTSIGENAFQECTSLTSVIIPDGVTSIGEGAFSSCTGLTSVTIPDSVTSIDNYVFIGCYRLEYNTYDNAKYIGNDSNPYMVLMETVSDDITQCKIHPQTKVINTEAFSNCTGLVNITIPDSVRSILNVAFSNCTSLTSITIPDSVEIGWHAFSGCSSLQSIAIPDCQPTIGVAMFSGCKSLTSITIPDGVSSIDYMAFGSCSSLTNITIPVSVTEIGEYAFSGCDSLDHVLYTGTEDQWNAIVVNLEEPILTEVTLHYNCTGKEIINGVCTICTSIANGDADCDGFVDAFDASQVMKYSVGAISADALHTSVLDVDGDGFVDAFDASLIQKYSVGTIDKFPVEE